MNGAEMAGLAVMHRVVSNGVICSCVETEGLALGFGLR